MRSATVCFLVLLSVFAVFGNEDQSDYNKCKANPSKVKDAYEKEYEQYIEVLLNKRKEVIEFIQGEMTELVGKCYPFDISAADQALQLMYLCGGEPLDEKFTLSWSGDDHLDCAFYATRQPLRSSTIAKNLAVFKTCNYIELYKKNVLVNWKDCAADETKPI